VPVGGAVAPYTFTDPLNNVLQSNNSLTYSTTYNTAGDYAVNVSASNATGPYACGVPVTVTGGGGTCSGTPSGTITATPARVRSGSTTHLAWTALNVGPSCKVTGPALIPPTITTTPVACAVTGLTLTDPVITTQSTYTLTCDGTVVSQVTVNILPIFQEF
jgi:hypothetical protein